MSDIKMLHLYSCELDAPTREVTLPTPLMHQDAYADVFRIHVTRGGLDLQLDGMTVRAWLYLAATGETMLLEGSADGSMAMVTLLPECYLFPGYATLAIQLQQGEECRTLIKIDLAIKRTCTDTVIDPSNVLPTLPELLAQIAAMEQATAKANAAAANADAAREGIQGDLATLTQETFSLESDNAHVIPDGTDFDNLKTPGNFKIQTLASGATMLNSPVQNAGRLLVMRTSQHDRVLQMYIANTGGGRIFWRLYDGAWSAWEEIAKASSVTALSNKLTAPAYYDSMLASKAQKINLELAAAGSDGEAFVFITDIHEKPLHTPRTMEHICRETNIRKIINNGDVAKDKDTKAEVLPLLNKYYNLYNFPGCDLYKVVGNHEFNNGGGRDEYADRQLSADELYQTIFGGNANNVTVDPAGTLAYYFDVPAAKMRYFVCAVNYKSTVNYESINWIIAEMENVPADYDVVVFCHHGLNSAGEYTTYTSRLVGALDAYKAHATYTNDYNKVTYDYSGKSGEVICMCVGDEHMDLSRISDGGIPIIATTCASANEELGGLDRVAGTTSESAYDVYVINRKTRTINATRIGAGSDREFTY